MSRCAEPPSMMACYVFEPYPRATLSNRLKDGNLPTAPRYFLFHRLTNYERPFRMATFVCTTCKLLIWCMRWCSTVVVCDVYFSCKVTSTVAEMILRLTSEVHTSEHLTGYSTDTVVGFDACRRIVALQAVCSFLAVMIPPSRHETRMPRYR